MKLDTLSEFYEQVLTDVLGQSGQPENLMNPDARRRCGAHYTTEENIMKVLRPLFLDELRSEFAKCKSNKAKLQEFHKKLASLTFFDPACGCGNFLVLAYRELRLLEMDVLQSIYRGNAFDLVHLTQVDVDQFYGIEIIEFPVRIAETALWLMDHQMNVIATERFGKYFVRLPLPATKKSSIFCDCTNVKREPFIRILKSITNAISLTIIYASPKNSFVAFRSIVLVNIRRSPLLEQVC